MCRTDRNQKFYSGESNSNVTSLFNILITFSLTHPHIPYAQGMSDLLSPLLYVLRDEALAYTCFLSLISRCSPNFCVHSDSIALKIKLLGSLIARYDPELWSHLVQVGADQMLFVYRWLLLECKREFPFEDALRVLECMWSTIEHHSVHTSSSSPALSSPTDHSVDNTHSGHQIGTAYVTRSNSTSSSTISLRLFRELCAAASSTAAAMMTHKSTSGRVGLRPISHEDYRVARGSEEADDDYVGSENMMDESMSIGGSNNNKSRHESQNSQVSTAPSSNMEVNVFIKKVNLNSRKVPY